MRLVRLPAIKKALPGNGVTRSPSPIRRRKVANTERKKFIILGIWRY
jgi:hypothetical protein